MRNKITQAVLLIFLISNLNGQESGHSLFDQDRVHEVKFTFLQDNYYELMENNYEMTTTGERVPYIMAHVEIDGTAVDSIGVRFKGYTSYYQGEKKPIKIDFNEFVKGKRYDGLRKINLNNGTADPALQRDVISYDMLRSLGAKAPRTAFAKVYFNDEYFGMYQLIEQIDKTFLKDNFDFDDGNLFKNLGWSKFEWLGTQPGPYQEIFDLKTNEELNDWTGFIQFVDVLNNSSDADFKADISKLFNVDLYLKVLAIDVATNNWDSYIDHGRNWYIYEDTSTGIFHWLPWDYNLALAAELTFDPVDSDCFIFADMAVGTNGTTTVKFIDVSFSFSELSYEWDFGDGTSSTEKIVSHEYANPGTYQVCLTAIIDENCSETICENVSTTFDQSACPAFGANNGPNSFSDAFIITLGFDQSCCWNWTENCGEIYNQFSENGGYPIDQTENEGVLINRLLAVPDFKDLYYDHFCDLMRNHFTMEKYTEFVTMNKTLIENEVELDSNYLFDFEDFLFDSGEEGLITYLSDRVDQLNAELLESEHTCPNFDAEIAVGDLVINEFVASADSSSIIVDEAGETDDWIEIYNNTNQTIDLSGVYLSDNASELKMWKFPNSTKINGNEYLIVWADQDEGQSGFHANFKLNKSGDAIFLVNNDESIIDQVVFEEQETNIAAARIPNGNGSFVNQAPTFKFNNEDSSSNENVSNDLSLVVFPNPAIDLVNVKANGLNPMVLDVELSTAAGVVIEKLTIDSQAGTAINIKALPEGFYFIKASASDGTSKIVKFIKTI